MGEFSISKKSSCANAIVRGTEYIRQRKWQKYNGASVFPWSTENIRHTWSLKTVEELYVYGYSWPVFEIFNVYLKIRFQ